jgi:hypothetical protein
MSSLSSLPRILDIYQPLQVRWHVRVFALHLRMRVLCFI